MPAFPMMQRLLQPILAAALLCAAHTLHAAPPATPPTTSAPRTPPTPRWSRLQPIPIPSTTTTQSPAPSAPNNQPPTQTPVPSVPNNHPSTQSPAPLVPNNPPSTQTPVPSVPNDALASTNTPDSPTASSASKKTEEAPTLNAAQIRRYQHLLTLVIAPCCWVQPVSMHPSPASDQIKLDLKKRIVAGYTDKQILDAYVKRFGERILAIPPHQDIFWLPIAAAAFILMMVFFLILNWNARGKQSPHHTLEHKHTT